MSTPRIAAIHDLSCFGRCSLTIALPVLSAMGCQCCPLPTALLSAHTGFPGNTFLDLTAEMGRIADHWTAMDLQFDAIYSGFLGSADQVDTVARFFNTFKKSSTAVIVDPVMGGPWCSPAILRSRGRPEPCALTVTAARAKLYRLPGSRRTFPAPATCSPASSLEGWQGVFPFFRPPKPLRILSVIALRAPWPRDSQSRMA